LPLVKNKEINKLHFLKTSKKSSLNVWQFWSVFMFGFQYVIMFVERLARFSKRLLSPWPSLSVPHLLMHQRFPMSVQGSQVHRWRFPGHDWSYSFTAGVIAIRGGFISFSAGLGWISW